jgi:hypothetical protein
LATKGNQKFSCQQQKTTIIGDRKKALVTLCMATKINWVLVAIQKISNIGW